jgi:hypothetical protein
MKALVGVMALSATMAAGPVLAAEGDLCPDPKEVQGFKTCADVAKAEAEGEVVVYATNPEAAELRVLGEFAKLFPKIKPNYTRLQAGALYAKITAERQAKTYTLDAMQISDMGMILDFQKKNGYVRYVSPQMAAYKEEYKSRPEGYWTWARSAPRDSPTTPMSSPPTRRRKPGRKRSIRNGRTPSRSSCPLQGCSTFPGSNCGASTVRITGRSSAN